MDKLARLGRRLPPGTIRIGIAVDSLTIEAWKVSLLKFLLSDPAIQVAAIFSLEKPQQERPGLLFGAYERWSSKVAAPERLVNFSPETADIPVVRLPGRADELDQDDRARIAQEHLDVLIWLGRRPHGECRGLAHFGVWSLCLGDPGRVQFKPAYFSDAYRGEVISELFLLVHRESFSNAAVERHSAATQEGWHITRRPIEPLKAAAPMILRYLLDLLEFGPEYFSTRLSRCEEMTCADDGRYPNTWTLVHHLWRQAMRSIRIRLRDRGRKLRWFIAIRSDRQNFTNSRDHFSATGLHEISNQRESQEADPFVVDSRGRTFLFLEEVPNATDRGHISCREISDGSSVSAPTRIIAQPYHLSYPFVLFDGADFFMLPESSANATVELYRAVNFPYEWRLEQVLQNEVSLVDTTPFFHNGTWYFFTTAAETGEALLYYSDRLSGEWRYHRSNPICSDVRRARGAGALFFRRGKLIRPAQDCSVRYGYAITLNEITDLTPDSYAERLVETIPPKWARGLLGTHTLNATEHIEVLDGLRMR